MITNLFLNQKLSIESCYLDKNIHNHLLKKLKETVENTCNMDQGYILKVIKIIEIVDNNIISSNTSVIFVVKYEAETFKPKINNVISGKVCMIFQHGIFIDILNKMKVIIPIKSLQNFIYNEKIGFISDELTIKVGIQINIKIVLIKYENKSYSCIGNLIS
jgi:DNA-directed RNA polymerase subunit E'/Rpb7